MNNFRAFECSLLKHLFKRLCLNKKMSITEYKKAL